MKRIFLYISILCGLGSVTSCQDFMDIDSNQVIFAENNNISNAVDSVYYVTGIINKLQAIADRTVLLGELRGDLVDVTTTTSKDLRDVATFNIGDDNIYNNPRDYYAVINNCNYFLTHVDPNQKDSHGNYIFKKEYASVKAIRAWVYLQLAITYGKVPFVLTPITAMDQIDKDYPMVDLAYICDYFINNDGLEQLRYDPYLSSSVPAPVYGDVTTGLNSRLFFFPIDLVLGDLYLWRGSSQSDYLDAAVYYYDFLDSRNGRNSAYPVSNSHFAWYNDKWDSFEEKNFLIDPPFSQRKEAYGKDSEWITIIPMDSTYNGTRSELNNIFCSTEENEGHAMIQPSQRMKDISAEQTYCYYDKNTHKSSYAPKNLPIDNTDGDLRFYAYYREAKNEIYNNKRIDPQFVTKYSNAQNVRIYRRTQVYLRLAEALNNAGFPYFAYKILSKGVNSDVMENEIMKNESEDDINYDTRAELLSKFDFPSTLYTIWTPENVTNNTMGIHTRGSGYSVTNEYYQMPERTDIVVDDQTVTKYDSIMMQRAYQVKEVQKLITAEQALELSFEGTRYYDLLRQAMRLGNSDPDFLARTIKARRGEGKDAGITGVIGDYNSQTNWYLKWRGLIGK